jgi:hypothetical protein
LTNPSHPLTIVLDCFVVMDDIKLLLVSSEASAREPLMEAICDRDGIDLPACRIEVWCL